MAPVNGAVAFGGALRLFPLFETIDSLHRLDAWNDADLWRDGYDDLVPDDVTFFCEDAFGVQFSHDSDGFVTRFWNDTGEFEPLGLQLIQFFEVIRADPDGTLSLSTYQAAEAALGALALDEHFVATVTRDENQVASQTWMRMNAVEHMRASAFIARQIQAMPDGARISRLGG